MGPKKATKKEVHNEDNPEEKHDVKKRKIDDKSQSNEKDVLTDKGNELFEKLSKVRKEIAEENNVKAYQVFTNTILVKICENLPTNEEEFKNINGIGDEKLKKYGKKFINEINKFKKSNPDVVTYDTNNLTENKNKSINDDADKKKEVLTKEGNELFEILSKLRKEIADENGIKTYQVFTNSILIKICENLPTNDEEFKNINGIGDERLKKYGKKFINEINKFKKSNPNVVTSKNENHLVDNSNKKVEKPKPKVKYENKDILTSKGNELFEKLSKVRKEIAEETKVEPYKIFKNAVLVGMCAELPTNDEKFLDVYGVGDDKLEKYGQRFIKVIKDFVSNNPNVVTYNK